MNPTLLFVLALLACGGSAPDPAPTASAAPSAAPEAAAATPAAAAPAADAHGSSDAEPGSHADWCGEHAVPESQCTRCDASLIAAFQATGDWCAEHGLPESQCLQCNPDLKIERPPKEG